MPRYTVVSCDYPEALRDTLTYRLRRNGITAEPFSSGKGRVKVDIEPRDFAAFVKTLAELMTSDLMVFETARLMCLLPRELRTEGVLARALRLADRSRLTDFAAERIAEHLSEHTLITAEGFLRFRLQPVAEAWALAVETAGEELMESREYSAVMELIKLISDEDIADNCRPHTVRVILNADGTGVVTDSEERRVEYRDEEGGSIVPLLIALAPDAVEVYDLAEGGNAELHERIRLIFGERVRIFVKNL